jgi:hypothetical protein
MAKTTSSANVFTSGDLADQPAQQDDGTTTAVARQRRARPQPTSAGPIYGFADVENRLQDELSDDRIISLRADAAEQFVSEAALPRLGDLWVPGYQTITSGLAKEVGLAGLEDDPFPDLPPDQPQPSSGAVDGNIVVSFVDGVSGVHKQDVLDCCLFAQLVANGRASRTNDPQGWTDAVALSMGRLAWVVPSYRFVQLNSSAARFTIDQAILHILRGLLSGNEMEAVQNAIDAIKDLQTQDRRLAIFERNSHTAGAGNLQVDEVGETSGGNVQMNLGAFNFQSTDNVTNVLWFHFDSNNTQLRAMRTTLLLNEAVYARVRDAVQNRLVGYVHDYVGGVAFGDGI